MKRRDFIQHTAALSAFSYLQPLHAMNPAIQALDSVGIQLFSLPKMLDVDPEKAFEMLGAMGYKEIELYGPYPFSAESNKQRWAGLSKMLGFSASGFYSKSPKELKDILAQNGLKTTSAHTDLDTLRNHMGSLGEAAEVLGYTYVVLPAIPEEERQNLDDYKRLADDFNQIGEAAKKVGLTYAYHNHGYGFQERDGKIPINVLFEGLDPELVALEMDIFWTTAGGANPVDYLEAFPQHYKLMHLKDMKEKKTFATDGSSAQEWMALFPFMTTAGEGVLDLPAIITKAQEIGVQHFFVEQDLVANPDVALKDSLSYLEAL